MNYYEELGIRQDASVEDIRQAYRMLARLLHPDVQLDPNLKQLAECQMKRLGEIVAILIDPGKRSYYDDSLLVGNRLQTRYRNRVVAVPTPVGWWGSGNGVAQFALRYWFWILMGVFVIGLGFWSFMQGSSTVLDPGLQGAALQRDSASEHRDPQRVQRADRPKRRITPSIAEAVPIIPAARAPIAEKTRTLMVAPPEPHSSPALEDIAPSLFAAPEPLAGAAKSPPQSMPALRRESSFAGRWLYSPQAGDVAERGLYPATYVELLLVEHGGVLAGDYRARYKVLDQAVSPEVTFQIRGAAGSATSAKFAWLSNDSAKGQAEMTLRAPNVLSVTWWTTEFGRQATLGSGTAVLIRQQVP